jgi:hypothetical protein
MAFTQQIAQNYANTHQHGETADGTALWHCKSLSHSASSQASLTLKTIRRQNRGVLHVVAAHCCCSFPSFAA